MQGGERMERVGVWSLFNWTGLWSKIWFSLYLAETDNGMGVNEVNRTS